MSARAREGQGGLVEKEIPVNLPEFESGELVENFPQVESGRVAIGEAVEAELKAMGERRGRPKQGNDQQVELVEGEISRNLDEFPNGRTDEIAAQKAGFGNKDTYRQAKTVAHHATPELAQAMDQGHVAISTAAKLASAPVEVQRNAAADPKKAAVCQGSERQNSRLLLLS